MDEQAETNHAGQSKQHIASEKSINEYVDIQWKY